MWQILLGQSKEKDSTEKCLNIVADVSAHIDGALLPLHNNVSPFSDTNRDIQEASEGLSAEQLTSDFLQQCRSGLGDHTSQLERRLRDLESQISKFPQEDRGMSKQLSERSKIQEEIQSTKQCLKICNDAGRPTGLNRINIFEDVTIADNGDQIIVSTLGDLISAECSAIGARSKQWLGQMSDTSLLQLSKSFGRAPRDKGILTENEKSKMATLASGKRASSRG